MNILDYLRTYKDFSFKEEPFNECDALAFSLISYFPFDQLENPKKVYDSKSLLNRLDKMNDFGVNSRKESLLILLKLICSSSRYKGIKFFKFEKTKNDNAFIQFQAVSVVVFDFVFISFCGTDSSTTGWREDLNMSCVDIVPSEIEAIRYANQINKFVLFKKLMIGGHSKGGRLSIRAAKGLEKKKNLFGVYNFDGPNFKPEFYDDEYGVVEPFIKEYAPNESIIGRLFTTPQDIIVISSNRHLLNQHDAYSWQVDGTSFIREEDFTERSNNIVRSINIAIGKYNDEIKQRFVDSLFDLLEMLEIKDFSSSEILAASLKYGVTKLPKKWKNIPKEDRDVLFKILLSLVKEFIKASFA